MSSDMLLTLHVNAYKADIPGRYASRRPMTEEREEVKNSSIQITAESPSSSAGTSA
jgi:hypothetical protein